MDGAGREALDHGDRVRLECLRQVAPLARGLTLMTPVSVVLMLILSRAGSLRGAVWAALVVAPSMVAGLLTPTGRPGTAALERWQGWYRWYLLANLVTWAAVLPILRPPVAELEVQTAQLLVLVAVGTSLVLLGAFLPRTFQLALTVFGVSVTLGLLVWGIGVNRQLALMVPVYLVILLQMQHFMRTATVRSIRLALENEELLGELGTEQARLEHEASHDHLTGLLNRAGLPGPGRACAGPPDRRPQGVHRVPGPGPLQVGQRRPWPRRRRPGPGRGGRPPARRRPGGRHGRTVRR